MRFYNIFFSPAGAIPLDNPKMTDKDKCISCIRPVGESGEKL